jgi:hypothetical protein
MLLKGYGVEYDERRYRVNDKRGLRPPETQADGLGGHCNAPGALRSGLQQSPAPRGKRK